jgi:hypothetical protein
MEEEEEPTMDIESSSFAFAKEEETQQETMMIDPVEVHDHSAPHPGKICPEIADEIIRMFS